MKFQLARCYFNLKEYARASFYLQDQWSDCSDDLTSSGAHSVCYFLYIYAKYMSIMKKYADNRADLLNNVDLNYLDNLQSLRAELSNKYNKNQLDAYSLYVYGVVLSKLKLNDEAISVLIESIKKRPNLWCSWLELTNLIKSIEIVSWTSIFVRALIQTKYYKYGRLSTVEHAQSLDAAATLDEGSILGALLHGVEFERRGAQHIQSIRV